MTARAAIAGLSLVSCAAAAALDLGEQERAGKRIYAEGRSASGRELTATLGGDPAPLPASSVPCASCHGDDGAGRPEGGVAPSPVTWDQLTKPYGHEHASGRRHRAYDATTLARAILGGRDPDGGELEPIMPRYSMPPEDLEALIAYLKVLDRDLDPGIAPGSLRIATVLPTSGPLADVGAAMRGLLEAHLASVNAAGGVYGRRIELAVAGYDGDRGDALDSLSRLVDEHPPFALVSGFCPGAEARVAALAEERRIPLVGPLTTTALGGESASRYAFYLVAGLREQARVLGEYARELLGPSARAVVLHPGDPALADAGLAARAQLLARGRDRVELVRYDRGRLSAEQVGAVRRKGDVVIFLGGDPDLAAFTRHADALAWAPLVLVPGILAARAAAEAPARFDGRIFLAFPALPGDEKPAALQEFARLRASTGLSTKHRAAQVSAYSAAVLLTEALRRAGKALSRERLVATLEALYAFDAGLVPPLTFGPSRRIGALGAYVVAVDVRKRSFRPVSGWIPLE